MYSNDPYRSQADMPGPQGVVAGEARLVKVVPLETGRFALHVILPGRRRWWGGASGLRPRLAVGYGTSWEWGVMSERHDAESKLVTIYRAKGGTPDDADVMILTAMWEDYSEETNNG